MQNWNVRNGAVVLDEFHSGKKKIPVNRHRIPNVGDESQLKVGGGAVGGRKAGVSPETFIWDMDGRRHKKPKRSPQRVITSNASLHKVDLPKIRQPKDVLTPNNRGGKSQPANIGRFAPGKPGNDRNSDKFVDPADPRARKVPGSPHLNT